MVLSPGETMASLDLGRFSVPLAVGQHNINITLADGRVCLWSVIVQGSGYVTPVCAYGTL